MEFATVHYQAEGGIARIVMNRPSKRNALNHQLLDDLDAAFRAAEDDDAVQVIVLAGAGPAFCAGYDLTGSYYTTPPDGGWTAATALMTLRGIEARYQQYHGQLNALGRLRDRGSETDSFARFRR